MSVDSPFGDEAIAEVHLPKAPLVYVVAQIRYPLAAQLRDESGVQAFAAVMRDEYPVLHRDQAMGVLLSPEGVTQLPAQEVIWRLQDVPGEWQVAVSSTFVALTTTAYVSSPDFCERLGRVLSACQATFAPPIAERVGIRYVDRIDDPDQLARLHELVRAPVLGGWSIPTGDGVEMVHTFSETSFKRDDHQLLARWGVLPPNAVLDPQIPPTPHQAWILDLDVSADGRFVFDPATLVEKVGAYSDQIYRFFRWAVTTQLIHEAGGTE
jgi:uncharacterized protein (TIGR04255 family)